MPITFLNEEDKTLTAEPSTGKSRITFLDEEQPTEPSTTQPIPQPVVTGISVPPVPEPLRVETTKPNEAPSSDTLRGLEVSMRQVPQLAYGVAGLVGATSEQITGYGDALRDWGFRGYKDWEQSIEPVSKETDDVTVAWKKAQEGDIGALVDWAQYGIGYALGQLGETAAISALGALAGGAVAAPAGPAAVPAAAGGAVLAAAGKTGFKAFAKNLIEKGIATEARKIVKDQAEKQGIKLTEKQIAEQAQKESIKRLAGKEIGSNAAIFANSIGMELGGIYGEAESQARAEGRELTGVDLARIWGTGLAAGGLEGFTDKIGLDLLKGKLSQKLPAGRLAGAAVAGGIGILGEGLTEAAQTALERAGAGKDVISDDAVNEYINAASLGALGGGVIGGAGGFIAGNPKENAAAKAKVAAEASKNVAPATADEVAKQADAVIQEVAQETPDQRVARLKAEAQAAKEITLEEQPPVVGLPPAPEVAQTAQARITEREGQVATPVETPAGTRIEAAAYQATDGTVYYGASHLDAMAKARDAGKIDQAAIDAKQEVTSRETPEFGFATNADPFITRDQAETIARESGQITVEQPATGKLHSNEVSLDAFAQPVAPTPEVVPTPETAPISVGGRVILHSVRDGSTKPAILVLENEKTGTRRYEFEDGSGYAIVTKEENSGDAWSETPWSERVKSPSWKISQSYGLTDSIGQKIQGQAIRNLSDIDLRAVNKNATEYVAKNQNKPELGVTQAMADVRAIREEIKRRESLQTKPTSIAEVTPPVTPEVAPTIPQLEPLRRVARAEQTEEDVAGLVDGGLVELYKGQPVLTQAGLDALPEAERPRLTPEARKIQIDTGANDVAAEAISKNLRIGVDQIDPNVRLPEGWTLEGDVYIPPTPIARIEPSDIETAAVPEEAGDVFANLVRRKQEVQPAVLQKPVGSQFQNAEEFRAAFDLRGQGHTRFAIRLDLMQEDGAITEDGKNLILATIWDNNTNDEFLSNMEMGSARKNVKSYGYGGRSRQTVEGGRVEQKPLLELIRETRRGGGSLLKLNALTLNTFWHEFGHAGYYSLLDAKQKKAVDDAYNKTTRAGRRAFFAEGKSDIENTPWFSKYYAKNQSEWFAQSFAEYVITQKSDQKKLVPVFEQLLDKIKAVFTKLFNRKEKVNLNDIFDFILRGEAYGQRPTWQGYTMSTKPAVYGTPRGQAISPEFTKRLLAREGVSPQDERRQQIIDGISLRFKRSKNEYGNNEFKTEYDFGGRSPIVDKISFNLEQFDDSTVAIDYLPSKGGKYARIALPELERPFKGRAAAERAIKRAIAEIWMDERVGGEEVAPTPEVREARREPAITPQQDADYLAAVERGDLDAASRMVEDAARAAGYNVLPLFHGTEADTIKKFRKKLSGIWLAFKKEMATPSSGERPTTVINAYADLGSNPITLTDEQVKEWQRSGSPLKWMRDFRLENRATAVIIGDYATVVFQPSQVKSADTVTRDNQGNIIPLSQRFQPEEADIRYARIERDPEVQKAAQDLKAGTIDRDEYQRIVDMRMPLRKFEAVPTPATNDDMLRGLGERTIKRKDAAGNEITIKKQDLVRAPESIAEGTVLESRLDIPAYENADVWVVSLHEPRPNINKGNAGPVVAYTPTSVLRNVEFGVTEQAAANIAAGKPKTTIATMKGEFVPMTAEQAYELANTNKEQWVEIGMNPVRHSYFYDKDTQTPVVSAEEVVQVGGMVLAKNPVFGKREDYLYARRVQMGRAGMEQAAVEARLQELGFPAGGIIRVVNQPDAEFEGRTIIVDGKVTGIELNAAAMADNATINRVLNHEFAESANADGALNKLVERLTPKEKKEINDTITRLRYEEKARTTEEAARAIETLAEAWKGRGFFTRAVARIEAWANKLGLKLTRRAAEYIAARNLADINSGFRAAYNQSISTTTEAGQEIRASRREPEAIPIFTEGTPEAATLKEMATSMAKVDAASEAKGGKPETYKISEIASVWMDSGLGERELQDAIVEYTNLTPANAARVARAIARQYDIQQSIATAFLETQTGLSVEALPEGVTLPKEVDPDRPKPVMQRLFEVFMGVKVPPKKITGSEKAFLRSQILLKIAANRAAKNAQKATADAVVETIKSMGLYGEVRPKQVAALAKRAAKVIWTSEKSVEVFNDYAARVVANANYDADLREAKASQKRAKQLSKQKEVAMSPQRQILDYISRVAVNRLDDPRMFADVVNYYMRAFKKATSPDYVVMPDSEMTSYLSQMEGEATTNQAEINRIANERLAAKYGVSVDEVGKLVEADNIVAELQKAEDREAMENLLTEKAVETQLGLSGYDTSSLSADQKPLVEALLRVDPSRLDSKEKQKFIRIANNVIYNDQTNGAQMFVAIANGQQNAREAAQDSSMIKKNRAWIDILPTLGSKSAEKAFRNWALELQSVADTFRNIFGKESMGKMFRLMGLYDLDRGFTDSNNVLDKIQEAMAEFYKKNVKKYKAAARNQDGILSEGIVGFLIQRVPAKGEAESIAQRRDLIKQDIANRRSSQESDRIAMADRIEKILNEIDGNTVEEILNNLKQKYRPNYDSVMYLMNDLLPQYKEFLQKFDENFNDQANNYDNPYYLPIDFISSGPALEITPESEAQFYDNVSLRPKQAANTIKRVDYTKLPTGKNNKPMEIQFNLRKGTYDSLSEQINSAYTSEAWQKIFSFMKTPEAETALGGAANRDFMVERLNRLRISRMRRGAMNNGAMAKLADSISVIGRKLGVGIALGGVYQVFKQSPDQLISAIGTTGRPDLLSESITTIGKAKAILDKFSIGRRGDASAGYKYINQMEGAQNRLERAFTESKWSEVKESASKVADVWMLALKKTDFACAAAAWMTYYRADLDKRGIKFEGWDREAQLVDSDPARQDAASFAENMTDIYQGSSDPTKMATFAQSGKSGWENLFKAIFVPFNSFAVQQRMRIYSDARDAFTQSGEAQKAGGAGLTATIGGMLMFHTVRRLLLPVLTGAGATALYALLGVDMDEPDEEKQKEEANKRWRQFQGEVIANMLVGGAPQFVEAQLIDAINYSNYLVSLQLESDDVIDDKGEIMSFDKYQKERSPLWRYRSFDNAMTLGMLDIGFGQAEKAVAQTKMLATPEEMEKYTPEEQRLLWFSALSEWMYLMRLNDADFARMVTKARKDMIAAVEDREKRIMTIREGR